MECVHLAAATLAAAPFGCYFLKKFQGRLKRIAPPVEKPVQHEPTAPPGMCEITMDGKRYLEPWG